MPNQIEFVPCGFLTVNDRGRIVNVNPYLEQMLDYESGSLLGKHIEGILTLASRIFYQTHFFPLMTIQGGLSEVYVSLASASGADVPVLINGSRIEHHGEWLNYCAIMPIHRRNKYEDEILRAKRAAEDAIQERDKAHHELEIVRGILEVQKNDLLVANEQLQEMATTDALTGVKNRRALFERLEIEISAYHRSGQACSVLIVDVDHFKRINDSFGHGVGDQYLREVAQKLERIARKIDLVARYGGEEFVVLLPNTDEVGALLSAERHRQAIESSTWPEAPITISIGVATLMSHFEPAERFLDRADSALYNSKARGRNRVTHFNEIPVAEFGS